MTEQEKITKELEAMHRVAEALDPLSQRSRIRVLWFIKDKIEEEREKEEGE